MDLTEKLIVYYISLMKYRRLMSTHATSVLEIQKTLILQTIPNENNIH